MSGARAQVWSRYWASGALHSCGGSFDGNYGGPLAAFWHEAFAALPPGARVLDLACGNGPLAQLMLGTPGAAGLRYDGVDLAQVQPAWASAWPQLHFHPRTAAEALPFDDAAFHLVISQYGLEYAELGRALPELQRVRAPRSSVRLVMHHADSLPVQLAREEIGHLSWALSPQGLLAAADAILEPLARAQTDAGRRSLAQDRSASLAREAFNAAQDAINQRLQGTNCPDVLHEMRTAIARPLEHATAQRLPPARAALEALRLQLDDALLRLQELCMHALGEPAARAVAGALQRAGEVSTLKPLADGGRLLGWALKLDPAA